MSRLTVRSFSPDALLNACEGSRRSRAILESKQQVAYLISYLTDLNCKTIVREQVYVDRDFLEDHSAYYVKCFGEYSKRCERLHFFSSEIAETDLNRFLRDSAFSLPALSSAHYLGFVVLKPLPEAFIGRTCLATYPSDGRRHYKAVQQCTAHFAGKTLEVESLAFQEQDTVLAACATTAIWSALQRTGHLFRHTVPTPAEITSLATQYGDHRGRVFPSLGLELGQMCRAVHCVGLEAELREGSNINDIRGLIYAYSSFGLPIILGVEEDGSEGQSNDAHAITVVGYSQIDSSKKTTTSPLPLTSSGINQLYVHDDQIGPFVRARIMSSNVLQMPSAENLQDIVRARIFAVLIPVHRKIRIRYERALAEAISLGTLFAIARLILRLTVPSFLWDVRLAAAIDVQAEYASQPSVLSNTRSRALTSPLPRFLWRISALTKARVALDLLIDATDIDRGFAPVSILPRDTATLAILRQLRDRQVDVHAAAVQAGEKALLRNFDKWMELIAEADTEPA